MDLWGVTSEERGSSEMVGRLMAAMVNAGEGWVSRHVDLRQITLLGWHAGEYSQQVSRGH